MTDFTTSLRCSLKATAEFALLHEKRRHTVIVFLAVYADHFRRGSTADLNVLWEC